MNPSQSSFHPGHGMKTVLIVFMDDFQILLDQCRSALLLLLDLIAIFNMLDYNFLTHHLADVGKWEQPSNG